MSNGSACYAILWYDCTPEWFVSVFLVFKASHPQSLPEGWNYNNQQQTWY